MRRGEARRAVGLAPRSAAAYASLARTLTHDLLGRHFRRGMDWASAAEAYAKALELDPSDVATRTDYAPVGARRGRPPLCPRHAAGQRGGRDRKAQRQLGPRNRLDSLEVALARALLFSEKYAELEKLAARAEKSTVWRGFLVAAIAARQGVADADRKAAEIFRRRQRPPRDPAKRGRVSAASCGCMPRPPPCTKRPPTVQRRPKNCGPRRRRSPQSPYGRGGACPGSAAARGAAMFTAALSGSKARQNIPALFVSTASARTDVGGSRGSDRSGRSSGLDKAREDQVPPLRIVDGVLCRRRSRSKAMRPQGSGCG